ncbi:hypothetical protein [Streptomyces sp. NBC_01014]|uniref:hypothetical protein n=1 Tax=Streptomyces sp. NBC_01014 TaxID=2903719 RepID=UPI0038694A88|nr:hypothetical protein OG282_20485 [Streptomyces sp. NBC_01014]
MYGPGPEPSSPSPAPSGNSRIFLRVLFAASSLLTCGFLMSLPLFRIALLRGRRYDWALAVVSVPVAVTCFAVVGELPEADPRTDMAMAFMMLCAVASAVYFLVVDLRHHDRLQQGAAPGYFATPQGYPPHAQTVSGYGFPPSGHPMPGPQPMQQPVQQSMQPMQQPMSQPVQHPAPQPMPVPQPQHTPPPAQQAPHQPPQPPRPPHRSSPHRIDQVRAELDELSDYLRKEEGR